jgi:phosphate ABC transporter phosphate-binding protein
VTVKGNAINSAIKTVRPARTPRAARRLRLVSLVMSVLAAFGAFELAAAAPSSAAQYVPLVGAGSSWVYPAMHAWIADVHQFQIEVQYTPNGSTAGRNAFKAGLADYGASEIPYGVRDGNNFDPPPSRGYAYIPDAAGGTTFMYNLSINGHRVTNLRLSDAVIAGIFTNKITKWNDSLIKADNPGLTLPALQITPVVRSDGSGATAQFTEWMLATEPSYWTAYCQVTGKNPCTQTSTYPIQGNGNAAMVDVPGDAGVSSYVAQAQSNGAIGYVEYSYALEAGFPVAKVLNAAGYYTEPTPGHVAVSLLKADINKDPHSPLYLTQDLSKVYTDPDPRTYELSSYSYMIIPTDLQGNMTSDKGYTLAQFGSFVLCVGQSQVDVLGYSALPIDLVQRGFDQLRRIPGSTVPPTNTGAIAQCHNPTFSTNGTNTLAVTDPFPPKCDKQGSTQCTTGTGGAGGGGGGGGGGNGGGGGGGNGGGGGGGGGGNGGGGNGGGGNGGGGGGGGGNGGGGNNGGGNNGGGNNGGGNNGGGNSGGGKNGGHTGGGTSGQSCDPNTGICTPAGGSSTGTGGTGGTNGSGAANNGNAPQAGGTQNPVPLTLASNNGDGVEVALMALAAGLLFCLGITPPLVAQASRRRRQRRGYDESDWPGDTR